MKTNFPQVKVMVLERGKDMRSTIIRVTSTNPATYGRVLFEGSRDAWWNEIKLERQRKKS